jgi:uncharacterized protein
VKAFLAALLMLGTASCGSADAVPAQSHQPMAHFARGPNLQLTGRVVDAANLIDDRSEEALSARLRALESATSDQLVVVTVPSLNGQTIERFTLGVGKQWGIGRAGVDNGVIILLAPTDRRVRVEVGLGLEGLLTDAKAGEIIKAMLPRFETRDYVGGLKVGVDRIDQLLRSDRRRPQPKFAPMREAA